MKKRILIAMPGLFFALVALVFAFYYSPKSANATVEYRCTDALQIGLEPEPLDACVCKETMVISQNCIPHGIMCSKINCDPPFIN